MSQLWVQANTYSKFILVLGFVLPVSLGLIAWKIERMFPEKKKAQVGGNRARA